MNGRFIEGLPGVSRIRRSAALEQQSQAYLQQEQGSIPLVVLDKDADAIVNRVLYDYTARTLRVYGFNLQDINNMATALISGDIPQLILRDGTPISSREDIVKYITEKYLSVKLGAKPKKLTKVGR